MTAFLAVGAPLAPATDTTALDRPLLGPTATFSITASVPHFSGSLLVFSFSITGAPAYLTSTSTVPPPCAVAAAGHHRRAAPPPTRATAMTIATIVRIVRCPPRSSRPGLH